MADQIVLELFEDRVSITLLPEVSVWTKARNITVPSALEVASLLMRSGSLHDTITVKGEPEVVCQVAGGSEESAWLGISQWGYAGDPDLVGFLEGEMIHEIGHRIHDLCLAATKPDQTPVERKIFIRDIKAFFLVKNGKHLLLSDVMPAHP